MTKHQITYFSVGVNVILTLAKLAVGIITGSAAIISEAAHSGSDLVTSFISLFSVREAEKPPDRDHPYGHDKYENIGSFFEALIIIWSGIYVFQNALYELIMGLKIKSLGLGLLVMLFSAVANYFISEYLIKKGTEMESPAIVADGWHSRSDVFTATGVFISLIIVQITGWTILDPLIAIAISFVILSIGVHIGYESFTVLVDSRLPEHLEAQIKDILERHRCEYIEYHSFRSRKAGGRVELDLHLVFPDGTSLGSAHKITEKLENDIEGVLKGAKVLIHMEPCENGTNLRQDCRFRKDDRSCSLKYGNYREDKCRFEESPAEDTGKVPPIEKPTVSDTRRDQGP